MTRAVVAVIALLFVAAIGVYGLQAALADAGVQTSIDREQFTPTEDTVVELSESNVEYAYYDQQAKVWNGSGVLMSEGSDYIWYADNGTIRPLSGGDLVLDNNGEISYNYSVPSQEQRAINDVVAQIPTVFGLIVPVLGIVILLLLLKG